MTDKNEQHVSEAFSRQSEIFDTIYESNKITTWMRDRVRKEVLRYAPKNASILELNAGTGIDSAFFAQRGYHILATDNADGMLHMLQQKIRQLDLKENLSAIKCSFNNLEQLHGQQFDYVFSNFGGLNCTEDLVKVLRDMDVLLRPGGHFTLVIMPKVCPWELLTAFRGYFKTAFRRFNKNGAIAHLEGTYFKCYYYSPSLILKALPHFTLRSLKGLCITVPPPYIEHFVERHPKAFRILASIEMRLADMPPFNRWCDHYVITMQKP